MLKIVIEEKAFEIKEDNINNKNKVIINDEAQKNKIKVDKIFKEYLKKTLYKYTLISAK